MDDPIGADPAEMDRWGIETGWSASATPRHRRRAVKQYPERFIPSLSADPNTGMEGIRRILAMYERYGIRAVGVFPAGTFPQVPINDKKMYRSTPSASSWASPSSAAPASPAPASRPPPSRSSLSTRS